MRKFIGKMLAWIGGITVCGIGLIFVLATFARSGKAKLPAKVILELNLETEMLEDEPDNPFLRLAGQHTPVIRDIVEGLERAGGDSRVSGLIARIGAAPLSLAQAQEIRDAVIAFRAKKKFTVVFSETFGEFGPGNGAYYLATAFDQIWLQPSGDVGLLGLSMSGMFFRGTFDKLGIVPRMDQRYEYKNAMNQYTDKKFTAPHREALQAVLNSFYGQMVRGISQSRKLPEDKVRAIVDRGPMLGKEALDAKLVDALMYRDEAYLKAKVIADGQLLYLEKYLAAAGHPHDKGPVVALIHGVGAVVRGRGEVNPLEGSSVMGSDRVTAAFRQAIQDHAVKA
ncbi:MAG: S49 family peptidase, partial [Candidatus Solibacter usitatus]|nr:S49 family peptidase [Candidatus Solibacter usitatus]